MVAATPDMSPHPFDPLTGDEIRTAIDAVRKAYGELSFQAVSLLEPRKSDMVKWLADEANTPRPVRIADVTAIGAEGKVYDGFVDLTSTKITKWELLDGVQPIVRHIPSTIHQSMLTGYRSRWRSSWP